MTKPKRQPIYILVGAPGSGKSWIARQVGDKFHYVPHDTFGDYARMLGTGALKSDVPRDTFGDYARTIAEAALKADKPILCDTPFSLSNLKEPLEERGFEVHPIFVIETPEITRARYEKRENKPIPKGHITRIGTYFERAKNLQAPHGTSDEMLKYLKDV